MNDISQKVTLCLTCHYLVNDAIHRGGKCPRCHSHISKRKKDSLVNTITLTLAALFLYIPANIFPIMTVKTMNQGEPSTILGGVISLIQSDMYFIGGVVFFASIVIPLVKIASLLFFTFSIITKRQMALAQKTKLFSIIEFMGKWSMLDIYVIAILAALVKIGFWAEVNAEVGANFFAMVVIITMFAAQAFDTRLFWDLPEDNKDNG